MKKIFSIICLALISLGLVACGMSNDEKIIDLEDVLKVNDYTNVLKEHKNILTNKVTFSDLEKEVITNKTEELLSVDENGNYYTDVIQYDADGKFVLSESARGNLIYQNCDGKLALEFLAEELDNQAIINDYFILMPEDAEYSEVKTAPLYAYFEVKHSFDLALPLDATEEPTEQTVNVTSTYFLDLETLLYTNVEHVYMLGDELLEIVQHKYLYDIENFEPKLNAFECHNKAEDLIDLTIVVDYGTEEEKSYTYKVSQSATMSSAVEGYRLYKNKGFTKDVTSLDYIYDYATIYYQPAQPEINWTYQLTDEDLTEFIAIRDELQASIIENKERELVESLMEDFNEKFEFIESHYIIGQVNYYKNTKNTKNYDTYMAAVDMYYAMFDEYKAFCKAIWESESIYKEEFFEGWSEEDIESLYIDQAATELRQQLTEIEEKANKLNYNAPGWSNVICNLFKQYVDISKEYAEYYGYDNYYEYATENVYSRDYSKEELEAFHKYVKEYIVPLTKEVMAEASRDNSYLPANDRLLLQNIAEKTYNRIGSENYLDAYIESFNGELKQNFKNLFEKNSFLLQTDSRAYAGAFVNYIPYYEEPFAYFGPGYQTIYTIVHEMGHYAAAYNYNFGALNYDLAETHSQANEWLFTYFMKQKLAADTQAVLVKQNLAEALQMVVIATAIDEFEQTIYYGNYLPTEYDDVMTQIHASYDMQIIYSLDNMLWYWKMVTTTSAVYYISYATSQIASINLYVVADQYGYEYAQEVYRKLQEEGSSEQGFVEVILNSGLPNPFLEQTYIDMMEVFSD